MNIFQTPLVVHVWKDGPELNTALRKSIAAHREQNAGIKKSNSGGWHSEAGQLEFCGDAGQRLLSYMRALGDEATRRFLGGDRGELRPFRWSLDAWANVNFSGDFNKVHAHPGSTWSGTYYVDAGSPSDAAAPLHLIEPCQGRGNTFFPSERPSNIFVQPVPGLMVLFPSYVPHMVIPHQGADARISIAFNLRKDPYP